MFGGHALVIPVPAADRQSVVSMARATRVFSDEEVVLLEEHFQAHVEGIEDHRYQFLGYYRNAELRGFICWGPTPLSTTMADVYWVCTAREAQRQGIATKLFAAAAEAAARGGRLSFVVWMSGRSALTPVHGFLEKLGFRLKATIADYYDKGDAMRVYLLAQPTSDVSRVQE
jgi:ribosomal protein S18 acetylase RimI-like enzyme